MAVFACVRCGAPLTVPVSQVALPAHAHQTYGHVLLPPLMEPGTYAVDPEPSGPPWRPWSDVGEAEAEARGVFARSSRYLSFGAPGAIALAPGDTYGMALIPDRLNGYCLGLDRSDGPNLACTGCGHAVATRVDDCSLWQAVWLAPDAVRRLPCDGPQPRTADWDTLVRERRGTPPVEQLGDWNPKWEAAAGMALARLLAAAGGAHPVAVPDGLLTDVFGRTLAVLLPPGPSVKTLALAGPGLADPDPAPDSLPRISLVPLHPQTGEAWRPPSSSGTGVGAAVPLAADVWMYLAFGREQVPPIPVTGGMPDGVLRDDPLPLRPLRLFWPDRYVFLDTLARLPAVRGPWLREIFDRVNARGFSHPC
ncbi:MULTISPECIES: hypothetical protein [Streptomyces]|uniref:DNA primase n=2 Tax=Streptomyces TaxID=1883 RepID=A0ABV9IJ35_9ACTN